jgi:type II secretory pathway component PulK
MTPRFAHHQRRRHGTILIVTMFIVFTLASLVLVMCGSMRVEAMAAANMAASLQASAVERGAEQYVMAILTEQKDTLSDLTEEDFGGANGGGIQVGDGYFWILRPNYGDDNLPVYGFTEENAKVNINTASYESLMRLPNMTDDVASAIINWRGTATTGTSSSSSSGGGQESYYASQPDPYTSKHAPFETVEEMLLVQGASRQLLYGDGTAPPLGTQGTNYQPPNGQTSTDLQTANGIYDLLTVFSAEKSAGQQININDRNQRDAFRTLLEKQLSDPSRAQVIVGTMGRNAQYKDAFDFYLQSKGTLKPDEFDKIYPSITTKETVIAGGGGAGGAGGSGGAGGAGGSGGAGSAGGAATGAAAQTKGRINVNTAPRSVLLTLPGLEDADVDKLISQRQTATPGDTSVVWVADTLQQKAVGLADKITGKSSQYSADILAVSGNGRGYKHCRIVINTSTTTPQIVYRRDLTERGWPMDPEVLAQFRTGQAQQQGISTGGRSTMAGGGSSR